jgi:CheY-like chemotaxis protein
MHRIQVVDDEQHIGWVISKALEKDGYEVLEAANGEDCLCKLENQCLDLVILDIRMPGTDGLELLKRLRKSNRDLPVIMITAAF